MIDDPIVAEVRQAREQHAARFNFDLQAIYQDLKEEEASGGRQVVAFPPRKRHNTRTPPTQAMAFTACAVNQRTTIRSLRVVCLSRTYVTISTWPSTPL